MLELKYFKLSEFDQHGMPGSGRHMDENFLGMLDILRERCGHPLVVSSGYRSPEYNASVSSTGFAGPHTTGKAADIRIYGAEAYHLLARAMELGFKGIGIQQKGVMSTRYIHLDMIETKTLRPRVWSY